MNATVKRNKIACLLVTTFIAIVMTTIAVNSVTATEKKMNDINITIAVENEFFIDSAVPFNDIDVKTYDGIVTLSGQVDNILAKDRAIQLTGTVKGVRSVVDTIEVKPKKPISAVQLIREVKEALLVNPATDSYEVTVTADGKGRVILNGTVDSWAAKDLCTTVTKGVRGVTDVENNITIDYHEERTDSEIKTEIEQRLRWNALVDHALIAVEVDNGKVTLNGIVGSAVERRLAFVDAWVNGVKSINDTDLKVARWARDDDLRVNKYVWESDDEIRNAIKDAILCDPRVVSGNIDVNVLNGWVTLRGSVESVTAKQSAVKDARNTVGVRNVTDYLKVKPKKDLEDSEITKNLLSALVRDPYIEHFEITVKVSNGIAHLYGIVDSFHEKAQAEDVASSVNGVVEVKNHIQVEFPEIIVNDPYVQPWIYYGYRWYSPDKTYTWKTDWQIKHDIEDELWWSPFVDADQVTVLVDDGVATLTGSVDSWLEYYKATENALEGGAIKVINKLEVG